MPHRPKEVGCGHASPLSFVREWQFIVVLALSVAATSIIQYNGRFWYGGSDHSDYYNYAQIILGRMPGYVAPQWRTPGMGIFYILSGTVLFDTWKGFIALYALFSVAIPLLIYLIVRPRSRNLALLAALITILSAIPYVYSMNAFSDHLHFFLHAAMLLLCVSFLRRERGHGLLAVAIALTGAYANMVRPVSALLFWIFVAVALVARPRQWRSLVLSCGVYITAMAVWVWWDRDYGTNLGASPAMFFPLPNHLPTKAERRLAEAYFSRSGLTYATSDEAAQRHPRTAELRQTLHRFLFAHPEEWEPRQNLKPTDFDFTPTDLFGKYMNDPDMLLDRLFVDPNILYFAFIVRATHIMLGQDPGLELIRGVASEHGTVGIHGFVSALGRNPGLLIVGPLPNLSARSLVNIVLWSKVRDCVLRVCSVSVPEVVLDPNFGPGSRRFIGLVEQLARDYPLYASAYYKGALDDIHRDLTTGGGSDVYRISDIENLSYTFLTWYLSTVAAGRLYLDVALEVFRAYPKFLLLFYDNFLDVTVIRGLRVSMDFETLSHMSDARYSFSPENKLGLTPGLASELKPPAPYNGVWKTAGMLNVLVYFASPIFLAILILALPLLHHRAIMGECVYLILTYLYAVVAISVFASSQMRYEATFYLLPLVIACMIFGQAYHARNQRREQPAGGHGTEASGRRMGDEPARSLVKTWI
jgi:hypothetical protein